jgi:hypothetical protein
LGLWRTRFYEHAAFYGGTALRIFHGLPRFSEDLDFTLAYPQPGFKIMPYMNSLRDELAAFGFEVVAQDRPKKSASAIDSAFIKADTLRNLLIIKAPPELVKSIHRDQRVTIRLEIDTDPPPGAEFEVRTVLKPIPFQVKLVSLPDLFAGKLHALLCRQWKTRVKGRDFFDFIWFVGQNVQCHLRHLEARMVQTKDWDPEKRMTQEDLWKLLDDKFQRTDIKRAADDVRPFVRDPDSLLLWSTEFFCGLAKQVRAA